MQPRGLAAVADLFCGCPHPGARGSCAKTLLLLSVSPAASSAPETLRTARFGERCAAVCLGSVRKQARSP